MTAHINTNSRIQLDMIKDKIEDAAKARGLAVRKFGRDEVAANRRRGGDIRVVLGPKTCGATSGFMGVLTLEPAEFVSEHYHPYSEEFLHVIRGSVVVRVDNRPVELSPDESIMVPKGVRHRVENNGADQAYIVFHLGPLAPSPALGHVDTEPLPNAAEPALDIGGGR
jgi:putative monooxygenase